MGLDLTGVDLLTETVDTARLLLRPWRDDDVPDITLACNDALISRWLSALPAPYTESDAREYLAGIAVHERQERTGLSCAMQERVGKRLSGAIGLGGLTDTHGAVFGYWVAPWARGHGYAAEATRSPVGLSATESTAFGCSRPRETWRASEPPSWPASPGKVSCANRTAIGSAFA